MERNLQVMPHLYSRINFPRQEALDNAKGALDDLPFPGDGILSSRGGFETRPYVLEVRVPIGTSTSAERVRPTPVYLWNTGFD